MGLTDYSDKRQKILPTTDKTRKKITDYRGGPTSSIFFFSGRRVYCIFPTFLGSNQRYHVTILFAKYTTKRG